MRALIPLVAACSFTEGKPASHGWPSGNPDDYAYATDPACRIYRPMAHMDALATLASSVVLIAGLVLRSDDIAVGTPLAVAGGAITVPFLASAIAGAVGESRCARWSHEIQMGPVMTAERAGRRE